MSDDPAGLPCSVRRQRIVRVLGCLLVTVSRVIVRFCIVKTLSLVVLKPCTGKQDLEME